jgi:hypothetical protein
MRMYDYFDLVDLKAEGGTWGAEGSPLEGDVHV